LQIRNQLLVIFDVEGVLYDEEYLPILSEKLNKEDEIWEITKQGIQGKINWEEGLKTRVAALKGLDEKTCQEVADSLPIMTGAKEACRVLKAAGWKLMAISGGKRPRLKLFLTYHIFPDIVFGFGGGFQSADPQPRHNPGEAFLAVDRPFGYLGGWGKHFAFKINWDTRSNRVFPLDGFHTELSFEPNWVSVNVERQTPIGLQKQSQKVTFSRYTFSDSRFLPIKSNRLILANRIAFEAISGDAPYYEFGQFSGQRNTRAVGGSQSLRGFNSRRFQDKIKLITLTELRFNYRPINLMSESFGMIFIAFF